VSLRDRRRRTQGAGGFGELRFDDLMAKSRQKAWKRGEEGCGGLKEEGTVVRLVVLGEEEVRG